MRSDVLHIVKFLTIALDSRVVCEIVKNLTTVNRCMPVKFLTNYRISLCIAQARVFTEKIATAGKIEKPRHSGS